MASASASEFAFQNEMATPAHPSARGISTSMHVIRQLVAGGWLLGKPDGYSRELALYEEDVLGFVKETQDKQWQKSCALYPKNTEGKFLERVDSSSIKPTPMPPTKKCVHLEP